MPQLGVNPLHDKFLRERHFPTIQTGSWRGPGSWCHRVYCLHCGFEELADGFDEARDLLRQHDRQPPQPAAKKRPAGKKAPGKKVPTRPARRAVDIKWGEEFF